MKFFRFSDFQVLFGLFRTTQDTVFFILVVDTFAVFAALRAEIEVAMEIENEHLTEIPHLGVLCVRGKSGEVFGLDAIALARGAAPTVTLLSIRTPEFLLCSFYALARSESLFALSPRIHPSMSIVPPVLCCLCTKSVPFPYTSKPFY